VTRVAREAELNLGESFERVCRRDTVSGGRTCYLRRRHDVTRSVRLEEFRACVGNMTRGERFRGHGALVDSQMVRQALATASRECARQAGYHR
jgi:hypothetical protein